MVQCPGRSLMTLQQLRYVIMVADKGSMSEAAKALFVSQPAMSKAIRELEEEIDCQLFVRTSKGIVVSTDGSQFMGYARQVLEQMALLEEHYLGINPVKIHFGVSAQHYSFVVQAFSDLIREYNIEEYDLYLRETRTYQILNDVKDGISEIGILYINGFNEKVLKKLFKDYRLSFHEMFVAAPHVFISHKHPLSNCPRIKLSDLENYPFLAFEQGENNSFYFSEEILSTMERKKIIYVSDRATLFNLLIGVNGYTISTGLISQELNGDEIVAVPLETDELIHIGYIVKNDRTLSRIGENYISKLYNSLLLMKKTAD